MRAGNDEAGVLEGIVKDPRTRIMLGDLLYTLNSLYIYHVNILPYVDITGHVYYERSELAVFDSP